MTVFTEKLVEYEERFLDFLKRVQEPVVSGVKDMSEKVAERMPEFEAPWVGDTVPTAHELLETQYGFAQKLLDNSEAFAGSMLDATEPMRDKVATAEDLKPAPAAKATTKSKAGAKKKAA